MRLKYHRSLKCSISLGIPAWWLEINTQGVRIGSTERTCEGEAWTRSMHFNTERSICFKPPSRMFLIWHIRDSLHCFSWHGCSCVLHLSLHTSLWLMALPETDWQTGAVNWWCGHITLWGNTKKRPSSVTSHFIAIWLLNRATYEDYLGNSSYVACWTSLHTQLMKISR